MRTTKPKRPISSPNGEPLVFVSRSKRLYKLFYVCGGRLAGPWSGDATLQQTGDTATVPGQLVMCNHGWHAGDAPWVWVTERQDARFLYFSYTYRVFAVRLSGGVWKEKGRRLGDYVLGTKYIGRTITMLHEVEWSNKERKYVKKAGA